mgnify:CR=1 FL=1
MDSWVGVIMAVGCAEDVGSVFKGVGKQKWVKQSSVPIRVHSSTG